MRWGGGAVGCGMWDVRWGGHLVFFLLLMEVISAVSFANSSLMLDNSGSVLDV